MGSCVNGHQDIPETTNLPRRDLQNDTESDSGVETGEYNACFGLDRGLMGEILPRIVVDSPREVVYEPPRQARKPIVVVSVPPAKVEKVVREPLSELATEPSVEIILEPSTRQSWLIGYLWELDWQLDHYRTIKTGGSVTDT